VSPFRPFCVQGVICSSAELIDARKYKSNQQEYDAFAKIINKHPDRATSNAEIEKIKEDVDALTIGKLKKNLLFSYL
jgi:hypothetical protein